MLLRGLPPLLVDLLAIVLLQMRARVRRGQMATF
jgi:hypothetical protein